MHEQIHSTSRGTLYETAIILQITHVHTLCLAGNITRQAVKLACNLSKNSSLHLFSTLHYDLLRVVSGSKSSHTTHRYGITQPPPPGSLLPQGVYYANIKAPPHLINQPRNVKARQQYQSGGPRFRSSADSYSVENIGPEQRHCRPISTAGPKP